MRCFSVSFLGSEFLPSGCLFSSLLTLSTWSLRVSCFLFCFRSFPLGSSSALLSAVSPGLFRLWTFPFLGRSWFLVPPLLVFSPLDVVGAFVYALSQVVLFLVSSHCPSGSCPSGGVPCCFFLWCCYLPYLYSGFFMRCLCLLSLRFLVLCVRSLAPLSAFFRGYFCCVLSVLGVFLLLVLLLFLPVLIRFCFSSFSFSDLF